MSLGDLLASASFPATDRQDWLDLVAKAVPGLPPQDALAARTADGIRLEALEPRRADAAVWARRDPASRWKIVQRIDDVDPARAAAQAQADMAGGATGLSLAFEGAPAAFGYGLPASQEALETVLDGVPLDNCHLRIEGHPAIGTTAEWLVAAIGRRRVDPARLSVALGIDPAAAFAGNGRLRMSIEALQASMPQSLAHLFALGLPGVLLEADGRVFHNAGATEAQELGAMLSGAVAHLRMFETARQSLLYGAPAIGFALAVDQDQFLSMAKIRALRRLWARIRSLCGLPVAGCAVHAETSWRMLARSDAETNILRNAIAVFAAASGGADSIAVLPHSFGHGLPEGRARRMARNTQLVIAAESHLDVVADPGAGSGTIEAITDRLCESAWAEFQAIEAEGGMLASLAAGQFQSRVTAARLRRQAMIADGHATLVGVTRYAAATDTPPAILDAARREPSGPAVAACERMAPVPLDDLSGGAA